MDPASAISLAGSVFSIVDVVTRMIKSLHELQQRWKAADLTVAILISQLTTLKAALNQIAEWISSSLSAVPQYHQLIIDLEGSLGSCNVLITFMDHHISKLTWTEAKALNFESRVRVVLEDKTTKDCLSHLNNQTNALSLLLTASSWLDLSDSRSISVLQARLTLEAVGPSQSKNNCSSMRKLVESLNRSKMTPLHWLSFVTRPLSSAHAPTRQQILRSYR